MKSRAQAIKFFLPFFFLLFLFIPNKNISADVFDLSFTLTEGGYRLELDSANPHKGVKLEVTSDIAAQYEITANIIRPLENKDNADKLIGDNFVFRGLIGTNKFGNLRVPTNDSPVRNGDVLYVSNTAGSADSFTLVYGIINTDELMPGIYFGRIGFSLRPISAARQAVTKILDVYINVEQGAEAKIEITPLNSLSVISLNSQKENLQSADVSVKISGIFKDLFSIKQVITNPLESVEGNQINPQAITFVVKEINKGQAPAQETPLSRQAQTIYTSSSAGDYDDNFTVTYKLSDSAEEKAGKYRSRIQFFLDEEGKGQRLIETLDLELEIERIFDFSITPQDNLAGISFANLKPNEPSRQNEVVIEVLSNIHKPYQISQNVYADLTSKEGHTIAPKYFTVRTEGFTDTKGILRVLVAQEVKKGDTILFVSDGLGAPDRFKIIYGLTCPNDIKAGDYVTRIVYSLLEI